MISSRQDISPVAVRLHDWWGDVDRLVLSKELNELSMPFTKSSPSRGSDGAGARLVITGVSKYEVHDTEQVRWYDLAGIQMDDNVIELQFGVPLRMRVTVMW